MDISKFKTKSELFTYLKENQEDLIYAKKSAIKEADSVSLGTIQIKGDVVSNKSNSDVDQTEIKVRAIINTTMVKDSHGDVHINGLWKKSMQENKMIKHLQEHQMSFKTIIADKEDLKAFTKKYSWKDLGVDAEGSTEALVFDSPVKRSRNEYMFKEYGQGNVDNHSVGMQYVKISLAVDSEDEDYEKEKAVYDKYIDDILNKEEVKKDGYFWAVTEAKAIEGSAVPIGSNTITPTIPRKQEPFLTETQIKENAIKSWLKVPKAE